METQYRDEEQTVIDKAVNMLSKREEKEKNFLFEKEFVCPVCRETFKAKMVRSKKLRLLRTGRDLRPIHAGIDTGKYDIIVCPECGYAALTRYFKVLTDSQADMIRHTISAHFLEQQETKIYSYADAYDRYRLALANAIVKHAKISEKSYLSLKMAWIIRGMQEERNRQEEPQEETENTCRTLEKLYLKQAYEGFVLAMENESYPICGMDEATLHYLTAAIATEIELYDKAFKLVAYVLHMEKLPDKLRQRAETLQEYVIQKKNT